MILDANVLLYSFDRTTNYHDVAHGWLARAFNGNRRIGLPLQSISAFMWISTHPRIAQTPLSAEQAWATIATLIEHPLVFVPEVGANSLVIFGELVRKHSITGNLIPDAQLAASAIELGVPVVTFDYDFTRFPVEVINPLHIK